MESLIRVAAFPNQAEARLAQATLAAANIESFIRADDAAMMIQSLDYVRGVQLLVEAEDAEEARLILTTEARPETGE